MYTLNFMVHQLDINKIAIKMQKKKKKERRESVRKERESKKLLNITRLPVWPLVGSKY